MAQAYLGKISALVTANTSDFQSKLNASAKDVRAFASTMQSSLSRAQSSSVSSLRGIYTETQKLERALKAAASQRLRFSGFEGNSIEQASAQLQRLYSATELINKPLVEARKSFDGLSSDVQAAFLPALVKAQAQVELLNRAIASGQSPSERSFEAVRSRVASTTAAIERLADAQERVRGLSTGTELRFQNPGFVAELERAARIQAELSRVPPADIQRSGFSQLVAKQRQAAEEVLRLQASIERASLQPGADTNGLVAQQRLALAAVRATNDEVARQTALIQATNRLQPADSASLTRGIEQEFLSLQAQIQRLPEGIRTGLLPALEVARARVSSLAGGFTATSDQIESVSSVVQQTAASLARAQSAAGAFGTTFDQIFVGASTQRAQAELQVLQGVLSQISTEAAGPARDAFETFRTRLLQAAADGTIGLQRVQDELAQLREQAVAAVSAVSSVPAASLTSQLASATQGPLSPAENRLQPADSAALTRGIEQEFLSLQAQIQRLPEGIRTGLLPALDATRARVASLAGGFAATGEQIESVSGEVQRTAADLARAQSAASAFGTAFNEIFVRASTRQAQAELQVLERILAQVGAAAAGPARTAFEAFRTRLLQAAADGTIALQRVQNELRDLRTEAIAAVGAVSGLSRASIETRVARAGDIARGASSNVGLAVQQLTFAVDDFFSVTGGLDQRIRAVGNNISQLGFILGGTRGLIFGVAFSIGAQLIAALIKWYSTGASTESQVQSLNDSLSKEKRLVDELASAFDNLADAIGSIKIDKQNEAFRRQQAELEKIRKKQQEVQDERVVSQDESVQRERALQVDLDRRLRESSNPAERLSLARKLSDSQERQRQAEEMALARVPGVGIAEDIARGQLNIARERIMAPPLFGDPVGEGSFGDERARQKELDQAEADSRSTLDRITADIEAAGDAAQQSAAGMRAIEEELARLMRERDDNRSFFGTDSAASARDEQIQLLERRRRELERQQSGLPRDQIILSAVGSASTASQSLQEAFDLITEAAGSGGSIITNALLKLQTELADATKRIKAAQALQGEAGVSAAEKARSQVKAISDKIAAELSAAESVAAFARAVDRASTSLVNMVVQESRQVADQARRDANAAKARAELGMTTQSDAQFRERQADRARVFAQNDEIASVRLRAEGEDARLNFEQRARLGQLDRAAQQDVLARDDAAAMLQRARAAGDAEAELNALYQFNRAQAFLEASFQSSPEAQRLRERANEFDQQAAARREREQSIERGRELALSPAARAASELGQGLRDLRAAAEEEANPFNIGGPGPQILLPQQRAKLEQDQANLIRAAIANSAPAISAMAESVMNAVVQGPSRAALEAVDVNTQEGSRELNRLLRGDDSAKNADFAELQRQSKLLNEILEEAKKQNAPQIVD
jgi:hypothetical protein